MNILTPRTAWTRLGVVLSPDGSEREAEGILNPGVVRDRKGTLLLYPRMVARGNVSQIGLVRELPASGHGVRFERLGTVLEPSTEYEFRSQPGGYGCEDPRVTFVPLLDAFVMTYTAFGPQGARIALALSYDGYAWQRLGLVTFASEQLNRCDNKDAVFFPTPVRSPSGVESFAFYHRPMLPTTVNGQTPIAIILALKPESREAMCLAYIPVADVLRDIDHLRYPMESTPLLPVGDGWGILKNGAGTPPIQTEHGWLSVFHAVDPIERNGRLALSYGMGILLQDLERPDRIIYRSPQPVMTPTTHAERFGIVNDVVFPTGLDPNADGSYDVYYGSADAKISRARFSLSL